MNSSLPISKSENTLDKITSYYIEGKNLTPVQDKTRIRWEAAFNLMNDKAYPPGKAAQVLMTLYDVSQAQAYRYVSNAIRLFGNVGASSKEGRRFLLYELQMQTFKLAKDKGNITEMTRALVNAAKIAGLDKVDDQQMDLSELKPHTLMVSFDPTTLGLEEIESVESLLKSVKSHKAKPIDDIQEADYTNE